MSGRGHLVIRWVAPLGLLASAALLSCGGGKKPALYAAHTEGHHHPCGDQDKVHEYDLHDEDGQDHHPPCAEQGKHDTSAKVRLETTPEGVKVIIHVTDDDVKEGVHGAELKGRDAMIVYPKGRDAKGVEVPLKRTPPHGYEGEKLIPFAELDKLTDTGTTLHVSILDHDEAHDDTKHEELKVAIKISAGKSCEKAMEENPQEITMGKKGEADLTNDQLGAPMKTDAFIAPCNLPETANADICVAVKQGKPLGVSVGVTPPNNKVAACIDRQTRKLAFPSSGKLDVVKQHF